MAYVAGLGATVAVMFYFKAAQPALFYLVPACLGATGLTALWRKGTFVSLVPHVLCTVLFVL